MKTKLGISIGLLGAATYFSYLVGGYIPLLIIVGYILLKEEDKWLRYNAIKACVLACSLSLIIVVLDLIPTANSFIYYLARLFDETPNTGFISDLQSMLNQVVYLAKYILFILLGLKALKHNTIKISTIDKIVEEHIDQTFEVK